MPAVPIPSMSWSSEVRREDLRRRWQQRGSVGRFYLSSTNAISASGLGKSDVEKRHFIGGLFREFTDRVRQRYLDRYGEDSPDFKLCRDGYYFEPSMAEAVFGEMLGECSDITVLTQHRVIRADVLDNILTRIEIADCRKTCHEVRSAHESEVLATFATKIRSHKLEAHATSGVRPEFSSMPRMRETCWQQPARTIGSGVSLEMSSTKHTREWFTSTIRTPNSCQEQRAKQIVDYPHTPIASA